MQTVSADAKVFRWKCIWCVLRTTQKKHCGKSRMRGRSVYGQVKDESVVVSCRVLHSLKKVFVFYSKFLT